jgi:hypothetical protein
MTQKRRKLSLGRNPEGAIRVMSPLPIILLVTLIFSACIQDDKSERRQVELPKTDPRTSLSTCKSIVVSLTANGLPQRLDDKFPKLTYAHRTGIILDCNETLNEAQFQIGKSVFIVTGVIYQGDMNQAKDIADFLESEAKKAVESYFAKPTS